MHKTLRDERSSSLWDLNVSPEKKTIFPNIRANNTSTQSFGRDNASSVNN